MKVKADVEIYEINGEEARGLDTPTYRIESHWNRHGHGGLVVITAPDGKSFSVAADDMIKAIERCHGFR